MRSVVSRFLILLVPALLATTASGHEVQYILGVGHMPDLGRPDLSGQLAVQCDTIVPMVGQVCFPAGHIAGSSETHSAIVYINDDAIQPTSGFYCQDLNDDFLCGNVGDYAEEFCGNIELRWDGPTANWEHGLPVFIFPDGPVQGSLIGPCARVSTATVGVVAHTT